MASTPRLLETRPASKKLGALAALGPFLRPYRHLMVLSFFALVLTAAVSLSLPLAVRRVVDGFSDDNVRLLNSYFGAALGIALALALGTGLRYYLVTRLGERVVADIRRAVFDRVLSMGPQFFENIMTGEVLSRLTTDTTLILSVIGSSVSVALRNVLMLFGGLGFLLATSAKLATLVLLLVPLVVVPIVLIGRKLRGLSRVTQDLIAESSSKASEALQAAQTVQAFTHEARSRALFGAVTESAFASARKRIGMRAMMTVIVIFLIFSGIVGILWIGARDVQSGHMSPGQLVQFLIYAVMVAGAVGALSEIWSELQRAAGATERLVELLQARDSVQDASAPLNLPRPVRGDVEFKGIRFRYPARPEISALDGISFSIKSGETVAIVGPSGAGKTTVFHLLQRFYDPQEGEIFLDGIDLRHMARNDFRRVIAMVPQDPVIFATTAGENIRFGRPEATDAEVEAAAKAAAADDFLKALPKSYDTYVGERGVMLSGGQKQRIAIARAILRGAKILLLDEATSALDAESERAVQEAVDKMAQERTVLVVAHRLATVKKADRIIVFDHGKIVGMGKHEALVAENGLYARLARLQFTESAL
ncbi:MAG: ATP-binding cassette subfamily B protein [Paracoccaceae bacterium]